MSKIFVISDTWFNRPMSNDQCVNVIDYNECIISTWDETVGADDKVYVLGGFGVADLYQIVLRLNGEIHFLDNYFNADEKEFMEQMRDAISKSSDSNVRDRIIFEDKQILTLNENDAVLSYLPLSDWTGRSTGTFCYHGMNEAIDIVGHNISCMASKWEFNPVDIILTQENILKTAQRV